MTSLYQQTIPVLVKYLNNLSALVEKGRKFADEKGMKHEDLITFRLVSDMQSLDYQVQACCNTAKFLASRVGGNADVFFADDETTLDELQARIARTIEVLQAVDAAAFDARVGEELIMKTAKMGSFRFATTERYVSEFVVPNFHFHLSTAYCLLRHQGVPIGAMDYMKDVFERLEEKEAS